MHFGLIHSVIQKVTATGTAASTLSVLAFSSLAPAIDSISNFTKSASASGTTPCIF